MAISRRISVYSYYQPLEVNAQYEKDTTYTMLEYNLHNLGIFKQDLFGNPNRQQYFTKTHLSILRYPDLDSPTSPRALTADFCKVPPWTDPAFGPIAFQQYGDMGIS